MGPMDLDEWHIVRLFPDYVDMTIWTRRGPISYADSQVSDALADDLSAWERSMYSGMGDFEWQSVGLKRAFEDEGSSLAQRLAAELGNEFVVRYDEYDIRSDAPATNEAAYRFFRELAKAGRARELEEAGGSLDVGGFTAYAPLSPATFRTGPR